MRQTSETILIICEGKNTEPQFFNSIRDEIIHKRIEIGDVVISIKPEPLVLEKIEKEVSTEYRDKRPKRSLKKPLTEEEQEDISGPPPLKWVLAGQKEMKSGTFNEVWVVFDHDNHPTRKEAFERAEDEINGSKVNIAFSSLAFEYYLLLHFERIYLAFPNTQCKTEGQNKKSLECGTNTHEDDCKGAKCINGYAHIKGYWQESKGQTSLFPIVKSTLINGFENSIWLRHYSDINQSGIPIYERNPYVTVDYLVKRLTGYSFEPISNKEDYQFKQLKVTLDGSNFKVENTSKIGLIIPPNSFSFVEGAKKRKVFGERKFLEPNEVKEYVLEMHKKEQEYYYTFYLDGTTLVFICKE